MSEARSLNLRYRTNVVIAQLVERDLPKIDVAGPIPVGHSNVLVAQSG